MVLPRQLGVLLLLPLAACGRAPERTTAAPAVALRVAVPAGLTSRSLHDPSHEEFANSILANVYEPLVEIGEDLAARPALAEGWHSPDDRTWVFRLRAGVRLHDGRHLDAAMAAAALNRHLARPWGMSQLQPVAEVRAQGPRDVVFVTRGAFLSLPERLTGFYIDGGPGADGVAVGSGRYRIVDWRADGYVALEAFAEHRDGAPPVARVVFLPEPDGSARARLLRERKAELALDVPPDEMARLAAEGFATQARPGLRVIFLGMSVTAAGPFRDGRVRAAVSLATDRQALVAGPLRGFGEPMVQLAPDGQIGHDRSLVVPPRDEKGARALLAAAGHGHGLRVELDYVPGKYLEIEPVVRALAVQLAGAGLELVLRPQPHAAHIRRIEARQSTFYVLGWLDDSRAIDGAYASLLHTPGPRFGSVNGGGYSNPRLDELIEQSEIEEDAPQRAELLRQATRIVTEEWPIVPLYRQCDLYAHDPRLGFRPRLDRRLRAALFAFLP